jgi:uncharacterized protein (TIGR02001 family)
MKFTKLSLVAMMAVSTITTTAMAELEVSANMAGTSNYVWRGMTQTNNSPAIQGGFDVEMSGVYAGVWGSNISWTNDNESSFEADIYAGYAGEAAGIGYDLGYITYTYANVSDANNFDEVYLGLSKDFGSGFGVSGMYSKGVKVPTGGTKIDDWTVGATAGLGMDVGLALNYGDYDTVGTRYSVGLSKSFGKFDVDVTYHDFSADAGSAGDEDNIVLTVGTSF